MKIIELAIKGVFLLIPERRDDERGYLEKTFEADLFTSFDMDTHISEHFHSISHKDVIRGMHFQIPPFSCAKYVSVSNGTLLDVVLDLRKESPTYGSAVDKILSAKNGYTLYIPAGCAHGFRSLENNTRMQYLQTRAFNPTGDAGICFDSFGFDWNISSPLVSPRDLALPEFHTFTSPFTEDLK